MKDIIPAKKQSPILGLSGMGGGVGGNLGGSLAKKTYLDDVFSTFLFTGNQTARSIVNGIDLEGEGGMVWVKNRETSGQNWRVGDTVRGGGKMLYTSNDLGSSTGSVNEIASFGSDGFNVGSDSAVNQSTKGIASWTFRKQKGFFDIVTFQQSGSDSQTTPQVVPHNLGVAPGMILLKKINGDRDWFVYHRDLGKDYWMKLNKNVAAVNENNSWGTTTPDANNFGYMSGYIGGGGGSAQFVAYLFGGGASTAAGAHSVYWPAASGQTRRILCGDAGNTTADFNFGTGDLTIECWIKCGNSQGTYPRVVAIGPQWEANMAAIQWDHDNQPNRVSFYCYNQSSGPSTPLLKSLVKSFNNDNQWHHIAVTRSGNTWRLFVDGSVEDKQTWTGSTNTVNSYCTIGNTPGTATTAWFGGYISNVRIVKGTAVYTSSFRPSTGPLKNITNTVLLCCNNLSATAATVTPIALTETAIMQNQTENPFDDPDGFKFGEGGNQNIVKCGSYQGRGTSTPLSEINVGFEPQWVMIKKSSGTEEWHLFDSMRGVVSNENDIRLEVNTTGNEYTGIDFLDFTPTGFKLNNIDQNINANNQTYVYIAIRRPDGYVGKPAEAGTDAFAMDTGNGSSDIPCFDSGFPVGFSLMRRPASVEEWFTSARLIQGKYLYTNGTNAEQSHSNWAFDSNVGWSENYSSPYQSWMWKRGAGFDVQCYTGTGTSPRDIPHNLGRTPEMIWIKNRDNTNEWVVGHKGLSGGANIPWHYSMHLQNSDAEVDTAWTWADTAPNSTHFTVHSDGYVNGGNQKYVAMLFASVDGISKLGSFTGTDSNPGPTITTGFQPRFIMIKARNQSGNWVVLDSLRGISNSGNDHYMWLNLTQAQENTLDILDVTSTGFTLKAAYSDTNVYQYIYYAHA